MTPFTLDEATEICEDFEDLRDTEFAMNGAVYLVEDILICPFPEADRQVFINTYLADRDGGKALSTFNGGDYDVILFVFDVEHEANIMHMSIRTYAQEQGIGYNFPATA